MPCWDKNKHIGVENMMKSTVAMQAERVVFLPGRVSMCVIVTTAAWHGLLK